MRLVALTLTGTLALLLCTHGTTHGGPPHPPGPPFSNADPPCFDNATRYADCGNGTVTDTLTGLVWLRDAACLGQADWATANERATTLRHGACGLSDGSRAGDWRLATEAEWAATILRAFQLNCRGAGAYPSLTDNAGTGCFEGTSPGPGPAEHAFVNVPAGPAACVVLDDQACTFWSSTTSAAFGTLAVRARLFFGTVNDSVIKTQVYGVWPVRIR
jgi:Protein of unknown function (DUF1566)